jgi:hypothetical protein
MVLTMTATHGKTTNAPQIANALVADNAVKVGHGSRRKEEMKPIKGRNCAANFSQSWELWWRSRGRKERTLRKGGGRKYPIGKGQENATEIPGTTRVPQSAYGGGRGGTP